MLSIVSLHCRNLGRSVSCRMSTSLQLPLPATTAAATNARTFSSMTHQTSSTAGKVLHDRNEDNDDEDDDDDDDDTLNDFFQKAITNTLPYVDLYQFPEPTYLKCGIAEHKIRFQTVAYGRLQLAPHVQPWEHRVTMRVNLEDMKLLTTPLEHQILHELVGPRMKGNVLQLSSNQFGSRIENKRHLVSMLDRIVLGAKALAHDIQTQTDPTTTTTATTTTTTTTTAPSSPTESESETQPSSSSS